MKILEINKNDLLNNLNIIKEKVKSKNPNSKLIAVVKANGMGLDLVQYSQFLIENGIETLAVACFEEAIKLRQAGIQNEILNLSPVIDKKELQLLIENDITLTIGSFEEIDLVNEIIENQNIENVKAHLKIDTGFGRYGFLYSEKENIFDAFTRCEKINIVGTFTHFSKPSDEKWTRIQFSRFIEIVDFIKDKGKNPGILHVSSSTALLKYDDMVLDAVRVGSAIQGRTLEYVDGLKKIGRFKTTVTQIKVLPKGYNISYGNTYKTKGITKIAVIPVGYVDGLNKDKKRDDFSLKNNLISVFMEIKKVFKDNSIKVKINNKSYKVIGRLGMYHSIIDVSGEDDIKIGDEVYLEIAPLKANDEIRREYI